VQLNHDPARDRNKLTQTALAERYKVLYGFVARQLEEGCIFCFAQAE